MHKDATRKVRDSAGSFWLRVELAVLSCIRNEYRILVVAMVEQALSHGDPPFLQLSTQVVAEFWIVDQEVWGSPGTLCSHTKARTQIKPINPES